MVDASGRRFRVGVVGTGFGARVHIPAYQASEDFEVVAVVSGRRENAERVAREAGIGWYSDDYAVMLDQVDLDVVSIATPGGLHHDMVLAAARAGRHILCEKPFATSLAEGQAMLAAVRKAGVGHAVNHEFRMLPARQGFKRMVDEGYLGTTFDVRALNDLTMLLDPKRPWSWWSDRAQYGGMLQAMTSHLIDMLLWTFGDIAYLSAYVDTFIRTRPMPDGSLREVTSDDQNVSLVRFASGAAGHMHVSGVYRLPNSGFEAHGSDGSLAIQDGQLVAARQPGLAETVEPGVAVPAGAGQTPLMVAYLRHVARAFRGETDANVATFEQGLRVQAVMDAMHASAANGGTKTEVVRAAGD